MKTKIIEKKLKKKIFNILNKMKGKEVFNFKFDDSFLKDVDIFLTDKQEETNVAKANTLSNNINLEGKEEKNTETN